MLDGYENGDKVKVTLVDKELIGIHLPRPKNLEGDVFVLKLEHGYNIGIDKSKIKKVEVLEKYQAKKVKSPKLKHKKGLRNISIISTGGTISSKVDYKTGGTSADYTAEDFVAMAPELEELANIKAVSSLNIMSEDMNETHWKKIAVDIEKELQTANGVVVTCGTDTLHYLSAALSFFFYNVKKPIIVTAAQRSIDRGSSDAFMNLICSVNAASNFEGSGVYVCMHANSNDDYCYLLRGNKVRKMHTSRRDAFRPINETPIAEVYTDTIKILNNKFDKIDLKEKVKATINFEEKVGLLQIYPLIEPELVNVFIDKGYKGIVISATALGHVPTSGKHDLTKVLKKAVDKGLFIVIATQTIYGSVHPFVYANLRKLSVELGLTFAKDLTAETALVKMGFVLGQTNKLDKAKEMFEKNYAYEFNEEINEEEFLN